MTGKEILKVGSGFSYSGFLKVVYEPEDSDMVFVSCSTGCCDEFLTVDEFIQYYNDHDWKEFDK